MNFSTDSYKYAFPHASFVYLTITMSKPLAQITFEFDAVQEKETPVSIVVTPEKNEKLEPTLPAVVPVSKTEKNDKAKSTRGRRSLKQVSITADLINVPADEELFKKQYYSIGEVAAMFRENQSLIRYWETEFDILQPRKNRKGDRFFRPVDIKNLVMIYDLLRRRKFTIEGAKDYLKKNKNAEEKFAMIQSLEKIKSFFLELKATL